MKAQDVHPFNTYSTTLVCWVFSRCGADTSRLDLAPESAGLYAISLGLSATFADDHEMLRHGMVMYDALYAWARTCRKETHNWPPKMTG